MNGTQLKILKLLLEEGEDIPLREVARQLKISPSLAHHHFKKMVEMGILIRRETSRQTGYYEVQRIFVEDITGTKTLLRAMSERIEGCTDEKMGNCISFFVKCYTNLEELKAFHENQPKESHHQELKNTAFTKDYLEKEYLVNEKSTIQIAKENSCNDVTISSHLKKFGISIRDRGKSIHLARKHKFMITEIVKNYIDGLLLGDGSVIQDNDWCAHYAHNCVLRSVVWLEKIKDDFTEFGIKSNIKKIVIPPREINNKHIAATDATYLYTLNYEELKDFRQRWYPEGKKIVPRDITITPLLMANWYMGDGSYTKNTPRVSLATNAFTLEDIEFLSRRVSETLGIKIYIRSVARRKEQYVLVVSRKDDVHKFLRYTEPYKVSCFDYKWDSVRSNLNTH